MKKRIDFWIDLDLYYRWVNNKQINSITDRLIELIKIDSNISDEEKKRNELLEELRIAENNVIHIKLQIAQIDQLDQETEDDELKEAKKAVESIKRDVRQIS